MFKLGLDPYASIGLTENPFKVQALNPDEQGERLLIGRDDELHQVAQRLHKHGKITCLDGHVGVGKTSLVNVATYVCYQAYLRGETPQLLIPAISSFQLRKDGNVEHFCTEVFQRVAQTLCQYHEKLAHFDLKRANLPQLNAWMNSPIVQHLNSSADASIGVSIPGVFSAGGKGGISASQQVNQSVGFAQNGLELLVRQLLTEIFGEKGNGGIVCVIDNVELLETAQSARRTLEALRDKLFNVTGLRWVLCGANGVIHSLAASPRLASFLSTPIINIHNVEPSAIDVLVRARLNEFCTDPVTVEEELPISLEDMKHLYYLVNHNLRDLLALADEFCEFSMGAGKPIRVKEKKRDKFNRWLEKQTTERYSALSSRISQNAWAVLDIAMSDKFNGTFGSADHSIFNQNSKIKIEQSTFDKWLRELVKLGLLSKSIDEGHDEDSDEAFNRDVYTVTAKGALVQYARHKKNEDNFSLISSEWMKRVHHN